MKDKTAETWCQFHQHFMGKFIANILAPKNNKAKCRQRKATQFAFVQKKHVKC